MDTWVNPGCDFCGNPSADLFSVSSGLSIEPAWCNSCEDFFWYHKRLAEGFTQGHQFGGFEGESGDSYCYACGASFILAHEEYIECLERRL